MLDDPAKRSLPEAVGGNYVEALEEFPNIFIQSETSASTHEYSESNLASKYVMLFSNSGTNTAGSVPYGRQDYVIDWYLFP